MGKINKLTVIVPVFNEEESLELFWAELQRSLGILGFEYEVILINDGSTDKSHNILVNLSHQNKNIKVISFSCNFGHEAAMTAGIDHCTGDVIICLDADLQHPPSSLSQMISKFEEGYEIVNMVRKKNEGVRLYRRLASSIFYRLLNYISPVKFEPNASDFFLLSRRVADILKNDFTERTRFLRGFIQSIGFQKTVLYYTAPKRIAGTSSYTPFQLFVNAAGVIVTFSNLPLRIGLLCGTIAAIFSISVGVYSLIMKALGYVPPGYTTIVVLISFLFAIQFFITGIIGEYLGFVFKESKKRPIYIIQEKRNF